jgi:hypothetical protein
VVQESSLRADAVKFTLQILAIFFVAYLVALGTAYLLSGHVTWSGGTFEAALAGTLGVVAADAWRLRHQLAKRQ